MSDSKRSRGTKQRRPTNSYVTKDGNKIWLNRNFSQRHAARRAARNQQKALYLSTLPKNRFKRMLYRLHPRHLLRYWFSREGVIMALKITGIGIIVCFFLVLGAFAYFRKDLPNIKDISGAKLGGSISYYDSTGQVLLWQDYNAVKRIPVQSNQIDTYMRDATVAIEDKNFYHEGGFSLSGIARAALHDLFGVGGGGGLQGASTITEQVVKLNENWIGNRTISTKIKEVILSVELSREYSKDDILTGYLNVAPYGNVEYGVESAAEDYFNTTAANLTLAQAAFLAAIPQEPTYFSPYSDPQYNGAVSLDEFDQTDLIARQHAVLDAMVAQGYISQNQANQAMTVDIMSQVHPLVSKYQNIQDPYFVLAAKQQLIDKYGAGTVQLGGWKVITTLNLAQQAESEKLINQNLPAVERAGGDEEATVVENVHTGQITSLIGGINFNNPNYGQINYAAGALIEPGSSFKPYVYATLINNNTDVGAGSVLYDSQGPIPGYPCTDKAVPDSGGNCLWDDNLTYPGPETLRYALGGSRNVPAVKAMVEADPNDHSASRVQSVNLALNTASKMMDDQYSNAYNCYSNAALTVTTQCYSSSGIGTGELTLADHANGLATLARMGNAIPSTYILKITDSNGKNIYTYTQPAGSQVINPQTAYIVNNMLSDPNASYFAPSAKFQHWDGWDFAIKTGTAVNNYDYLMVSYSTQYAVVTWVGNHTLNTSMTGSSDALTYVLDHGLMTYLHTGLTADNWAQPAGIQHLPAYVMTNITPSLFFSAIGPSPSTDIYPSWYKPNTGSGGTQTIDKVSGLLATGCTPADAKETVGHTNANTFSIDQFYGTTASTSSSGVVGNDNVHNCSDSPPSIGAIDVSGQDVLGGGSATCTGTCTISATPLQGTHLLNDPTNYPQYPGTLTITANGNTICSSDNITSGVPFQCSYTPSSSFDGPITATVTDSVLYQSSSSSVNVNFVVGSSGNSGGGGGGGGSTITGTAISSAGKTTISWTGGSAPYTVTDNNAINNPICTGSSITTSGTSDSCIVETAPNALPGSTVTITDTDGDTSSPIKVTT